MNSITRLENIIIKITEDNILKIKDQELQLLQKEKKDLEQELILTKIEIAQSKSELDEYEYQIEKYKSILKKENLLRNTDIINKNENNDLQIQFENISQESCNQIQGEDQYAYKILKKFPKSLLSKNNIVSQVRMPRFVKKLNPFQHRKTQKSAPRKQLCEQQDQFQIIDKIEEQQNHIILLERQQNASIIQSSQIEINTQSTSDESKLNNRNSQKKFIKRNTKQELLSASIYLKYFSTKYEEKVLDTWIKFYFPILNEGSQVYKLDKKIKREIKKGIPIPLRGQVWQLLIDNKLKITNYLFQLLKQQAQLEKDNQLLEEDIPRTFPHLNELFEEIQSLSTSLRQILISYSNYRPDLGYIQGMSYIAGMLLLHCGLPEECFKIFCNILNMPIVYVFYNFELPKIKKTFRIFWKLLSQYAPLMFENLKNEQVSCSAFLVEWILTLFSSSFEIEICACLWDQIFFYGDCQIIKIAVSICLVLQKKFYDSLKEQDGLALIKKARDHINKDELLVTIERLKLKTSHIQSLFLPHNQELNSFDYAL